MSTRNPMSKRTLTDKMAAHLAKLHKLNAATPRKSNIYPEPRDKYLRYKTQKVSAKGRKRGFTLDFNEFLDITGRPCHYCGTTSERIGIDRIDSLKGYVQGNCRPCCRHCNTMKWNYTEADFFKKVIEIYKHRNLK